MDGTVGNHIFPVFSASYPSCPFRLHEVDRRGHGCIRPSHVGNGEGKALAGKLTAAFVKSVRRRRALAQGIAATVLTPNTAASTTTSPPSGRRRWPHGSHQGCRPCHNRDSLRRAAPGRDESGRINVLPCRKQQRPFQAPSQLIDMTTFSNRKEPSWPPCAPRMRPHRGAAGHPGAG